MAKREWTKEQTVAIETRDKTLLVSAAAGSGKTATLTERIIRSILDEKNPISLKEMLIVTFTNAAVGELRERIGAAIKDAAVKNPDNARLEEELLTVKDAKIMTIDAFCNSILRSSAEKVGLPPNYRIGDGAELALLSSSVMEGLIEACYEGEVPEISTPEKFAYFSECLTSARGEGGLADIFLDIYEKTESAEEGIASLRPLIEEYSPDKFSGVENTRFGGYIMTEVREAAGAYLEAYSALRYMSGETSGRDAKAYPLFLAEKKELEGLVDCRDYGEMREKVLSFSFASLSGIRGEKSDAYKTVEFARKMLKSDMEKFADKFFLYSEDEWKKLYSDLYENLGILFRFLYKFNSLFTDEKKRRGICSYSDIERYAFGVLWQGGEKTDFAKDLAAAFRAVYIDEYQDVNALQNRIFEAVAQPDNRFMVGDIKQSIYGFRSAKPEIFADMKKTFPKLSPNEKQDRASLFMSANFRCDREIIDFVNGIFDKMFGALGDSIGYEPCDRLQFNKIYGDGERATGNIPEIHLFEKADNDRSYSTEEDTLADEIVEGEEEKIKASAAGVAKKIKRLIEDGKKSNGEAYRPKDIAIILRSAKGRTEKYKNALEKEGIKASIADDGDFFLNEEVLLALALLNSIDNPRKDIYLAGLLLSPLFDFTPDDLMKVRTSSKSETLYEALKEYSDCNNSFAKGRYFLLTLDRYRTLAEGVSVDSLLSTLYRETGLLSLAERNGGKDNLILLHNYAKNYEQSSFKGLYSFINYLNNIIEEKKKFDTGAGAGEDTNSVKILTAHKSKGLEFPACFFVEADGNIRKASGDRIAFAEGFGISMLLKDPSGTALVENPVQNAILRYRSDKEYEEELRILYVILTRAREALFVYSTSSVKNYKEKLSSLEIHGKILNRYFAKKFGSMFDIIAAASPFAKFVFEESALPEAETETEGKACEEKDENSLAKECSEKNNEEVRELLTRFNYRYPLEYLGKLPEKLSVSKLYPDILDGTDTDGVSLTDTLSVLYGEELTLTEEEIKPYLPAFVAGRGVDESAKRGIATHTFLQFCDFENLKAKGAAAELERLKTLEFLSSEDAGRVRLEEIDNFIASPLFREMTEAKKLYRELRFNLKFPAEKFTLDEELKEKVSGMDILVQGVIDCIIEKENGELHIIDYKTDRLKKEELADISLGEKRLRDTHSLQLSYYAQAVRTMFGKEASKIGIYSLHLGKEVEILK